MKVLFEPILRIIDQEQDLRKLFHSFEVKAQLCKFLREDSWHNPDLSIFVAPLKDQEGIILEAEIDGVQAEQLEFVPCGQIRKMKKERVWVLPRIRDNMFSFLRSRRPSQLHMCRKAPWRLKQEGGSDINLFIGLFTRIHLAKRCTQ